MQANTSPATRKVNINLAERSYSILVGNRLLSDSATYQNLPVASSALIVSDTHIAPLYLDQLSTALRGRFTKVMACILPEGETHKNWQTLQLVFDTLLENGFDRHTILFALGGGVVGDMTGFAAASYMRGVPFVQVPTTLLAQVDSSVGGKTAINHPFGKNMIGAFYQPQLVVCDLDVLKTLPSREISAGMAEIIKYGPIADMEFFEWIEVNLDALMHQDPAALANAVERCCQIKAHIVGLDEREGGIRAVLNFGHTFGHAIESGMGYGKWLHGEGVGCGMVMAVQLSYRLGMVNASFVDRLTRLIARAGLPVRGPILDVSDNAGRYLSLMRVDKKSEAGEIRFVLIDGLGHAVVRAAPDGLVRDVINSCCDANV